MSYFWICCALLAAETVPESRVTFAVEVRPLPAGLRLAREPQVLVLQRDGVPIHRLPLPVIPKKAQRKDDHAFLAMGIQGLWIVRLLPEGRLVVVARHRLPKPVDGFFFEANRVVPTTGGRPILRPPASVPPPSHHPNLPSLGERLRALSNEELARMSSWPAPREVEAPVSARPRAYLESSSMFTFTFPAWNRDVDVGNRKEIMVLRAGFHLGPNHVLGLGIWANFRTYDNHSSSTDKEYLLNDYTNGFPIFYRFSFPSRRIELQIEPLHTRLKKNNQEEWQLDTYEEAWGARLSAAWVKRSGPLRIGVECRFDFFARLLLPSLSIMLGINF